MLLNHSFAGAETLPAFPNLTECHAHHCIALLHVWYVWFRQIVMILSSYKIVSWQTGCNLYWQVATSWPAQQANL